VRAEQILKQQEEIKRKIPFKRRLRHQTKNACFQSKMSQSLKTESVSAVQIYLTTNRH
jgi:hypothetical protein